MRIPILLLLSAFLIPICANAETNERAYISLECVTDRISKQEALIIEDARKLGKTKDALAWMERARREMLSREEVLINNSHQYETQFIDIALVRLHDYLRELKKYRLALSQE